MIVYSTPNCGACKLLKDYLKENKVFYDEVDVSKDVEAFERMIKHTGKTSVPQIEEAGQWLVGFNRKKVDELIGLDDDFLLGTGTDAYSVCENCQ